MFQGAGSGRPIRVLGSETLPEDSILLPEYFRGPKPTLLDDLYCGRSTEGIPVRRAHPRTGVPNCPGALQRSGGHPYHTYGWVRSIGGPVPAASVAVNYDCRSNARASWRRPLSITDVRSVVPGLRRDMCLVRRGEDTESVAASEPTSGRTSAEAVAWVARDAGPVGPGD